MEKQVKRFKVDFNFDWSCVEIKKLKEDLDTLEKMGVTEIEITAENYWEYISPKIEAYTERLETDDEYKTRIDKENKHK